MGNSDLKTLIPGISPLETVESKTNYFMKNCRPPYHEAAAACQFDEDWDVSYDLTENGKLSSITFYSRKRIKFSKIKFPKNFKKFNLGIVHLLDVSNFVSYTDKYGLSYVIVDEYGDSIYRKGDLFYIEYGMTDRELFPNQMLNK